MSIQVNSQQKALGTFIVSPAGSLNSDTYTILEKELDSFVDKSTKLILFDLEHLEYLSSAGIRVFLKIRKTLKANGGNITFVNIQPQVRKVFEVINAIPSMTIFQSIEELDDYLDQIQRQVLEENK
ncbi:MAG: STAS domain-containing protein [Deltaproteobacteria bacterium]|nr:STAS domain-containing protein [Deltaproteobacteria bacterium]